MKQSRNPWLNHHLRQSHFFSITKKNHDFITVTCSLAVTLATPHPDRLLSNAWCNLQLKTLPLSDRLLRPVSSCWCFCISVPPPVGVFKHRRAAGADQQDGGPARLTAERQEEIGQIRRYYDRQYFYIGPAVQLTAAYRHAFWTEIFIVFISGSWKV